METYEDPRQTLARLRGETYTPPERQPEVRETYTAAEVEAIVDRRLVPLRDTIAGLTDMVALLTQQLGKFDARLEHFERGQDFRTQEQDIRTKEILRQEMNRPLDPRTALPPFDDITKIRLQFFDNRGTGKNLPDQQLLVHVWTCAPSMHQRYPAGTCGNFFIPLYKPGWKARRQLKHHLDYLDQEASFIGCVTKGGPYGQKLYDQAIEVHDDTQLVLKIGDQAVNCGFGKPQKEDAKAGASLMTWFWPELYGTQDSDDGTT